MTRVPFGGSYDPGRFGGVSRYNRRTKGERITRARHDGAHYERDPGGLRIIAADPAPGSGSTPYSFPCQPAQWMRPARVRESFFIVVGFRRRASFGPGARQRTRSIMSRQLIPRDPLEGARRGGETGIGHAGERVRKHAAVVLCIRGGRIYVDESWTMD